MSPVRDNSTRKHMITKQSSQSKEVGQITRNRVPLEIRPAQGLAVIAGGGLFLTGLSLTG